LSDEKVRVSSGFGLLVATCSPRQGVQADQRGRNEGRRKYVIPDVTLINQDRQKVGLVDLLEGKPVLVDFIYGPVPPSARSSRRVM
jgi:cytochrome oxidase Cu insertion factor (SCO1/SenC/PrrC family)